ncbi:glutamate-gated chloride channel isoform X5 [Contarinia nasturtii]|uniref:glutamate-gated chloride channel isoform X5 n=1 Tax=Contarinia nasturtii TaxID=265458 RepID=UPI0012D4A44F|nr:glutamate-gated chloride channel isoform X5 [Contarinia nasturtii]
MGFACKWVRQKTQRDCNQVKKPKQNKDHHQQIELIKNSVDRSINSVVLRKSSRRRQRDKDRYAWQTINEITTVTQNSNSNTKTIRNLVTRDDEDDIDITFEKLDDEKMANSCTIAKSIPSNRRRSLTPYLEQTKCEMDSNEFKMCSTTMGAADHQIVCRCKCETMSKLRALFAAPLWFAGSNSISRFIHMINFKRKNNANNNNNNDQQQQHHHHIFTLPPSQHTEQLETIAPTKIKTNYNNNKNQIKTQHGRRRRSINNSANNMNDSVHNKCDRIKSIYNKGHNNRSILTSSQCFIRQSVCLYAASGFLIALCFLAIPAAASIDSLHPIFAEGKSDKEILDHLLKNSRYDKRLLPPVDDADFCCGMDTPEKAKNVSGWLPGRAQNRDTLTVNVSVLLLSLASPDESSLKYEVEFLLQQQWYDPRLRYANQSQYEYLNAIHHHEEIWLPDTYFIMHGDFKDPIIPMHFALRIYRNGTINYLMRRHLILSCQGRLNIFPFDDPLCSFALESISYELSHITYVWKNDEDTLRKSPSLTTLNAYLIQNATTTCPIKASWRGNYSCLKVDLIFTRDRAFYFTTVFIPGIILVTSSFITFWLEWNAVPARVMIGVTTMLNFFTTSNGFRSTLPVVSNLTAMNVWDGVCMCFIYASLLEFVCVNYVGRKRPLHNVVYRPGENPVTQPGEKKRDAGGPNEIVACTNCGGGSTPCTHSANNGCATETCFVPMRKKEPPHPIRVAKTIDVIARITFPTAYAIFLIFFFIHYKGFS